MGRGYKIDELKQKLIDILEDSKMGLSGIEISEKLNVNRLTMTKYLKVLAAEGFLRQKILEILLCGFLNQDKRHSLFLMITLRWHLNILIS